MNVLTEFPEILDSPQQLFYRGNIDLIQNHFIVAVVGTRKPTEKGIEKTKEIIQKLFKANEKKDLVIISGLALGIDVTAHLEALRLHIPTIAVLPNPVNHIYPSRHTDVAFRIIEQNGLLLSEYDTVANQQAIIPRLITRNRIIVGLADIIVPVEYTKKSGTMHTIGYAKRQGKQIVYGEEI